MHVAIYMHMNDHQAALHAIQEMWSLISIRIPFHSNAVSSIQAGMAAHAHTMGEPCGLRCAAAARGARKS